MTYGIGVLDLHTPWVGTVLSMMLLVVMTYLAGRVHQFYRQTTEREMAYRDGYNQATRSLFSLATRSARGGPASSEEEPTPLRGVASVPGENKRRAPARHRADGRRDRSLADTKRMEAPSDQAA